MDYRELLLKYITYVREAEGTDFIEIHDHRYQCDVSFSGEEWDELNALVGEIRYRRKYGA